MESADGVAAGIHLAAQLSVGLPLHVVTVQGDAHIVFRLAQIYHLRQHVVVAHPAQFELAVVCHRGIGDGHFVVGRHMNEYGLHNVVGQYFKSCDEHFAIFHGELVFVKLQLAVESQQTDRLRPAGAVEA